MSDTSTVTVGSLCTGVAGLDLGLHMAYRGRTRHLWYSEVNPDACTVLAARLPGVANLGDLTAVDWATVPRVDVLTAGFPCQPVSAAGHRKGDDDERWLWEYVLTAIRTLHPQEVLLENVRNLVSIRKGELFARVLDGLQAAGYAVRWATAGACAVGGPHHRHRVFIAARYAWELTTPEPQRVDMIECGARKGRDRALLPTPTAARYGHNQGGAQPGGPVRWGLDHIHELLPGEGVLLPTPDAAAGSRGGPQDADVRRANRRSVALQDAVWTVLAETGRIVPVGDSRCASRMLTDAERAAAGLLPTPCAADGQRGPNPGGYPADNLTTAIDRLPDLLPTPKAGDTGTPGRRASDGFRPPLSQVIATVEASLLPTPCARDGKGGDNGAAAARRERGTFHGGENLADAAQQLAPEPPALLPTPRAADENGGTYHGDRPRGAGGPSLPDVAQQTLLPTPTVVDAHAGVQDIATGTRSATGYGPMLRDTATELSPALLPTPRNSDAAKGSPNQHGSRGDLMLPSAVIGDRYGRYGAAVTLWEQVTGMAAPEPTIQNTKGQWRLNPQLPEWMMGLPRGWVTGLVSRSAALRGCGNGVVPQVVAAVYPLLTADWPYLRGGDLCPVITAPAPRPDRPRGGRGPAHLVRAPRRRRRENAAHEQLTLV